MTYFKIKPIICPVCGKGVIASNPQDEYRCITRNPDGSVPRKYNPCVITKEMLAPIFEKRKKRLDRVLARNKLLLTKRQD
jgi:hypothetical protein